MKTEKHLKGIISELKSKKEKYELLDNYIYYKKRGYRLVKYHDGYSYQEKPGTFSFRPRRFGPPPVAICSDYPHAAAIVNCCEAKVKLNDHVHALPVIVRGKEK